MRCVSEAEGRLVLALPSKFIRDWVQDNYLDFLEREVAGVAGAPVSIELTVDEAAQTTRPAPSSAETPPRRGPRRTTSGPRALNERYSFDTFVCGASNQFAYAACKAVADVPATNYNPLFVFGGVGLGKTHLLNAIGLEIRRKHPDWNILLLSAETFTNEVIVSIRENRMEALRQKYREHCDVLLMDDIQFLAGKDRTQEEFFHTFNS
ncbi:MAG: AAA family ATPase, partial [Deltaproteobacteria bacterium]